MSPSFRDELLARIRLVGGHADVLGPLADAGFLSRAGEALAAPFASRRVTKVAGLEARGFVFGVAVALRLGAGFVPIRKQGAVHPGPKATAVTTPSWRGERVTLALQRAAIGAGDRVLVVDDWAETGAQAIAAKRLIDDCAGTYVGLSLLIDQLDARCRAELTPVAAVADASDVRE